MASQAISTQRSAAPQVSNPAKDVRALIMSDAFQDQIKKAMPQAMSSDVLLRVAVTTIQKTPKLLECSQASLMQCVLECAQMGLLPDGILGQAYMVPYKTTATLQIGYRGILELARRSNQIKFVVAEAVYDCDEFDITYAPIRTIKHVPDIDNEQRGEKVDGKYLPAGFRGVYALVLYKDDSIDFEYLPLHKVERIRRGSQAGQKEDAPWLNHFEEMARKTAIRSLGKRLPLSADDQRRIIADEYRDAGLDVPYQSPMELPAAVVEDAEVEALSKTLKWPKAKMAQAQRNFSGDRDALLAHLRGEAEKAGLSLAPQRSQPEQDTQEGDTTTEPETGTTEEASTYVAAQTGSNGNGAARATSRDNW